MHRIDTATAVPALPAILGAGANPNSYWQSGNPTTGAVPTVGDQDFFNMMQEELAAILAEAGIAPVKGTYTQVRDAIKAMIALRARAAQCYLQYSSNVQLTLAPKSGNMLPINGKLYALAAAGLAIANAGVHVSGVAGQNLAASTVYLLFAMDDGAGNVIPDFWPLATGHMPDTTAGNIGIEVRSNGGVPDSTRTLIGMVATDAAAHFVDSAINRQILSWFNRRNKILAGSGTGNATTGSPTPLLLNSVATVFFLIWAEEDTFLALTGNMANNTAGDTANSYIGVDGAQAGGGSTIKLSNANDVAASNALYGGSLAEGLHSASPFGFVNSGIGTFANAIYGIIRG